MDDLDKYLGKYLDKFFNNPYQGPWIKDPPKKDECKDEPCAPPKPDFKPPKCGPIEIECETGEVHTNVEYLTDPKGDFSGLVLTGFLDIEKIIRVNKTKLFIEKKLPFQILILNLDDGRAVFRDGIPESIVESQSDWPV